MYPSTTYCSVLLVLELYKNVSLCGLFSLKEMFVSLMNSFSLLYRIALYEYTTNLQFYWPLGLLLSFGIMIILFFYKDFICLRDRNATGVFNQ